MKIFYNKYKLLIPVSVMTILCIWTILKKIFGVYESNGTIYHYGFSYKHYIAFVAVGLSWITFFAIRPIFKYVLGLTLIVGIINFLSFTLTTRTYSYYVFKDDIRIGVFFQLASLLLAILTYLICFKETNRIISKPFRLSPGQKKELQEAEINKFKDKYSSYSDESLNTILEEKKYMPEALEAARLILEERSNKIEK